MRRGPMIAGFRIYRKETDTDDTAAFHGSRADDPVCHPTWRARQSDNRFRDMCLY